MFHGTNDLKLDSSFVSDKSNLHQCIEFSEVDLMVGGFI